MCSKISIPRESTGTETKIIVQPFHQLEKADGSVALECPMPEPVPISSPPALMVVAGSIDDVVEPGQSAGGP